MCNWPTDLPLSILHTTWLYAQKHSVSKYSACRDVSGVQDSALHTRHITTHHRNLVLFEWILRYHMFLCTKLRTSVYSYVASNIYILSVWLSLLTSNMWLSYHAVYVSWMWWLCIPSYYVYLRGELWLKHVQDFTCNHKLLLYINCVYLVVCRVTTV